MPLRERRESRAARVPIPTRRRLRAGPVVQLVEQVKREVKVLVAQRVEPVEEPGIKRSRCVRRTDK